MPCLACIPPAALVDLKLQGDMGIIRTLAGARVVKLTVWQRQKLHANLAGLTHLSELVIESCRVKEGWQYLPRQLQRLDLRDCNMQSLPAELAGLTQLRQLSISLTGHARITSGWRYLPQQLAQLDLCHYCAAQQSLPADLASLTLLTRLNLRSSSIKDGWQHLPRQLVHLDLYNLHLPSIPAAVTDLHQLVDLDLGFNALVQLPAELASLQLTRLNLEYCKICSGWNHLPAQLRHLNISNCALRQLPAEVRGLDRLESLNMSRNSVESGWEHLPPLVECLDVSGSELHRLPTALAGLPRLRQLSVYGNPLAADAAGGWQHLPDQLEILIASNTGLRQVPEALKGLKQLRTLKLGDTRYYITGGWQNLPRQLQTLEIICTTGVPAALTALAQLTKLQIGCSRLQDGSRYQHLPRQLVHLGLVYCNLPCVPPELAHLTQLAVLDLSGNPVSSGWQHLPRHLQHLDLSRCHGVTSRPHELRGSRTLKVTVTEPY